MAFSTEIKSATALRANVAGPVGNTRTTWIHVACILALVAAPFIFSGSQHVLGVFNRIFLGLIVVLGMFVILGLSKQFSLCQVAIYGVGAYTMANLTAKFGMPFIPALMISGLVGSVAGVLVAIPGARFQGPWLALVTFAFAEIARILFARLKGITGGSSGFPNIPRPSIFGWEVDNEFKFYLLFFSVALFAYFLVLRLRHSPVGRIWLALGDNPDIADSVGVNVVRYRILAFATGSLIASLAGALFASYAGFVSPESFGFGHTVFYLTILVVGGLESIPGIIVSVVIFELLHDNLMAIYPWDLIVDGLIIIIFVNFLPGGIGSLVHRWPALRNFLVKGKKS